MATKIPRVSVTLPADVKAVYERAGAVMGISASKYIGSFLIESAEAVEELSAIIETQDGRAQKLADLAAMARRKSDGAQGQLIDEIVGEKAKK